jgi:hypothetical protein
MKSLHQVGRGLLLAALVALAATGCKKGADEVSTKVVAPAVGAVAFPADVLGFAGVRSLDDLSAAIGGIASAINPQLGGMIGQQVPELLRARVLGVGSLSWVDGRKPLRVVVLDYKKFQAPFVFAIPVADAKALDAALPATKVQGETGTTYKTAGGQDVFLNRLGDFAVFTMAADAYPAAREFLRGDFAGYRVDDLIDAQVSSANLLRILAPEIEQMQKAAQEQAVDPTGAQIESLRKLIDAEVQMLKDLLAQTEVVRLVPAWNGQDLAVRIEAQVVPGKGLAGFVASTQARDLAAFKRLPSGGWLAVASNIDPALFSGVTALGIDFYASFLNLDEAAKTALADQLKAAAALQTGDTAFTILFDGEFPWRVATITGVTDGAKAREATYAVYGAVISKLGALIDQTMGAQVEGMPKLDWSSFPALVASIQPTLAEAGVVVTLGARNTDKLAIDTMELTIDYTKVPGGAADPAVQTFARVMGGKVSGALGFDDGFIYGAFGKDATAEVATAAQGPAGTGEPLAAALAASKFKVALAAHVAVAPLLKAVAMVRPDFADMAARVDPASTNDGLSLTLGAHGDRVVDAQVNVPVKKLAAMLTGAQEPPAPAQAPAPAAPAEPAPAPEGSVAQ